MSGVISGAWLVAQLKTSQIQYLRCWYGSIPVGELSRKLRIPPEQVEAAAGELGLRTRTLSVVPTPPKPKTPPALPAERAKLIDQFYADQAAKRETTVAELLKSMREAKRRLRARDHLGALEIIDRAIQTYEGSQQ